MPRLQHQQSNWALVHFMAPSLPIQLCAFGTGKHWRMIQVLRSLDTYGRPGGSNWPRPWDWLSSSGFCHLGNKPANLSLLLNLSFPLQICFSNKLKFKRRERCQIQALICPTGLDAPTSQLNFYSFTEPWIFHWWNLNYFENLLWIITHWKKHAYITYCILQK